MTTARDADILHAWAVREGLMPENVLPPADVADAELNTITPVSDLAKDILRRRGIQHLLVNEEDSQITILTKLAKPTKKQLLTVPREVGESSIVYRQGVAAMIGGTPPKAHGKPFFLVPQPGGNDGYACGSSVSLGNSQDAGTLSCLVRDDDGVLYGLSNNHVTGGCSHAQRLMPILAPGVLDVSPLSFDPLTIGHHERALPMLIGTPGNVQIEENFDAAIFKIADEQQVSSMQGERYDTPTSLMTLKPNLTVEKVGRTTGHTTGVVVAEVHGGLGINYHLIGVDFEFKGRVYFRPIFAVESKGHAFSQEGDSGALVTTVDAHGTRHAVGLVVGGVRESASGRALSFIIPIAPILERLNVSLVNGHNIGVNGA